MSDSDTPKSDSEATGRRAGINWNDPDVPAGNAPPMPAWPLILSGALWFAWIVFLVVTLVTQTRIDPI